jgi:hypothetical protein
MFASLLPSSEEDGTSARVHRDWQPSGHRALSYHVEGEIDAIQLAHMFLALVISWWF